jgi:hypothetical protein
MNIRKRSLSIPIKVAHAVLVVVFVTVSGVSQVKSQAPQTPSVGDGKAVQAADIPMCNGGSSGSSAGFSGAHGPAPGAAHPHSVTLSWNAAVAASNSPRDAIKGYYVYRSSASHTYAESDRISESPLQGTRCVDTAVEARKTYFYIVKAVTEGGKQSGSSIEIKAVVPFP